MKSQRVKYDTRLLHTVEMDVPYAETIKASTVLSAAQEWADQKLLEIAIAYAEERDVVEGRLTVYADDPEHPDLAGMKVDDPRDKEYFILHEDNFVDMQDYINASDKVVPLYTVSYKVTARAFDVLGFVEVK
jgi:hypothetical protein